jgi:hypothetical protein
VEPLKIGVKPRKTLFAKEDISQPKYDGTKLMVPKIMLVGDLVK